MNEARRVIAITGAGSGLGRALALHYARKGWSVAVSDADPSRASAVAAEVTTAGADAIGLACDVTQMSDLNTVVTQTLSRWQRLDIFVNNAGVAIAGATDETSLEDWQWIMEINLMGVVRGCKAALPVMKQQGFGHIVNIASLAGIVNPPAMAAYNMVKAGVISLSETLRAELHGTGLGITLACPSFFTSNLTETARAASDKQMQAMHKLVTRAKFSSDDIAAIIADAVERKQFLVLPQKDARQAYLLKRIAPNYFLKYVLKRASRMRGNPTPQGAKS